MRRFLIGMVVVGLVLGSGRVHRSVAQTEAPAGGQTEPGQGTSTEQGPLESFGWGMAAVGTNIVYFPAKIVYGLTGGVVGLLAWGVTLGNDDVGLGVLQPALGGTWVVTPEMLRGEHPIMFVGPSYEPNREQH